MANAMEGIMGLPKAPMGGQSGPSAASMVDMQALEQASAEANKDPMAFRESVLSGMEEADPQMVAEFKNALSSMQLPDDVIQALGAMVDEIMRTPQEYQAIREEMLMDDDEGIFADLLPETFDMAYFMALDMALDQLAMNVVQAPRAFANGGLATLNPIAQAMAQMGRNGDTMLAHITPAEARMLRARGGSGTINPVTGLPEFFIKSVFKAAKKVVKGAAKVVKKTVSAVKSVVKKVASSTIGRIALTIGATMLLGPAAAGFWGSSLGAAGALGVTSGAVALGVNSAIASTLVGVASGQKFGDALKGGVISGVTAGALAGVAPDTFLPDAYAKGAADIAAANATTIADVTAGMPEPLAPSTVSTEVTTPSDVSAFQGQPTTTWNAPTYTADAPASYNMPAPTMEPVWDPNLGESMYGNQQAYMLEPTAPRTTGIYTADAPAPYNMPAQAAPAAPAPYNMPAQAPVSGGVPGGAAPTAAAAPEQGVLDLLGEGKYWEATKQAGSNVVDFFDPRVDQNAIDARAAELVGKGVPYKDALAIATKEAPGVIARYAPLALAGTGILAASGAFTPEEPEEGPADDILESELERYSQTGSDLIEQSPGVYDINRTGVTTAYTDLPYKQRPLPMDMSQLIATKPRRAAEGGLMALARGGTAQYPRKNGHISGPGGPKDDKIPAMLSDGEFVFTAKAVRGLGNGSRRKGAKKMYALMRKLEGRMA